MSNLRDKYTDEEWTALEESLIGKKHPYERGITTDEQIEVDTIVESVRTDLQARSRVGINKYNTTLDRTDLVLKEWLNHAYEEALDMALYLKRAIKETK